jgi:hypothetical protein
MRPTRKNSGLEREKVTVGELTEVEAALAQAVERYMGKLSLITGLRVFSSAMYPVAPDVLKQKYFKRAQHAEEELPKHHAEEELPKLVIARATEAVDSASLVFAHSLLDDFVNSALDVCALARPADWDNRLKRKSVEFSDVQTKDLPTLRQELLTPHLKQLKRDPLVDRIEVLLSLCPPSPTPIANYKFSLDRLTELDDDRHKIIHSTGSGVALTNIEDDLRFITDTVLHLAGAVQAKHGLRFVSPPSDTRAGRTLAPYTQR